MAIWPDTQPNQALAGRPGQPGRLERTRAIRSLTGRGDPCGKYMKEISMRWYSVLSRFKTELPQLKHFAMGERDRDEANVFEQRYKMPSRLVHCRYSMFDCNASLQWIGGGDSWNERRNHRFRVQGYEDLSFPDKRCHAMDRKALVELLQTSQLREHTSIGDLGRSAGTGFLCEVVRKTLVKVDSSNGI